MILLLYISLKEYIPKRIVLFFYLLKMAEVPCDPKRYVEKKHICSICGYRTIHKYRLRRHFETCQKKKFNRATALAATALAAPALAAPALAPALAPAPVKLGKIIPSSHPLLDDVDDNEIIDENNPIDCRLIENFKIYMSGPSRCGKSVFLASLLKSRKTFTKRPPEVICFVYSVYQEGIYDDLRNGIVDYFIQDDEHLERNIQKILNANKGKPSLLIYDDLIKSINLPFIARQFTVNGRHNGISQVFVSQKLFPKDENIRLISNNSDYLVVFKNPRNATEIKILSNQMSPGKNILSKIFEQATLDPYSYLFIDLTQECIPQKKYLSHLFDSDHWIHTYIERMSTKDFTRMYLVSHKYLFDKPPTPSPPSPPMETDQRQREEEDEEIIRNETKKRQREEQEEEEEIASKRIRTDLKRQREEEEEIVPKRIRTDQREQEEEEIAPKRIRTDLKRQREQEEEEEIAPKRIRTEEEDEAPDYLKKDKTIEKKKHFCYICNKEYASERSFNKHVALVHEGKRRITKDHLIVSVPKKFQIIDDIKKLKPFICTFCGISFKNHTQYDKHIKSHQASPTTQLYKRAGPRRDLIRPFDKVT